MSISNAFKTFVDQNNNSLNNVLKQGAPKTEHVKNLQRLLYELGYGKELRWDEFGADGSFGNATTTALKTFGTRNGITNDGLSVNSQLALVILSRYETVDDVRELKKVLDSNKVESVLRRGGLNKAAIMALQRLLFALGYGEELKWEKFGADGDYGGATTAAVAAFVAKEGQTVDGRTVNVDILQRILNKFTPFLGDGWATAQSSMSFKRIRRAGQNQFDKLFPNSSKDRKEVEQLLGSELEFERFSHEIKGDPFKLEYYQVSRKDGTANYYFNTRVEKKKAVLHFTAGQIIGDLRTLTSHPQKISTAFVIGRDGTIYKLFASSLHWAWHLGSGALGTNTKMSPSSIGIEISNWGPLKEDGGGNLLTDGGAWYCSMDQTDAYIKLSKPYRDRMYYATMTPQQYESVIILLRYLTSEPVIGIKKNFLPAGQRDQLFASNQAARDFEGICCHTNFRPSGKWDLCEEAFDWEKIIAGLSGEFKPELTVDTGAKSLLTRPKIRTEAQMEEKFSDFDYGNQDPTIYGEDGPEEDV